MARGEIKALAFADGVAVTAATAAPAGLSYYLTDASTWNGTAYEKTYDLTTADDNGNTIADAKAMIWTLKGPSGGNYETQSGFVVTHPSATQVKIAFGAGFPPASGTYYLVGR